MKARRVRQLANRQAPYKSMTIYIIEGRDKWWGWHPAKTLDRNIIVWGSKKDADEWVARQSSQAHPGKRILVRSEQRYRVRRVQLNPSSATGIPVTMSLPDPPKP